MIDLLIPILGRPQNAQPLVDSIHRATVVPHTIIFIATRGDDDQIQAAKKTGAIVHLIDEIGYAAKINVGAGLDYTDHEFVLLGADDLRFHPRWDRVALGVAVVSGKSVIGTNDLANTTVKAGKHATHSLVRRSYAERGTIDEPGKLLHEGYHHQWVDNEFIDTAKYRDQFVFAAESHVEHLHPIWGSAPMDSTYQRGLDRKMARKDQALWRARSRLWR